MNRKSVLTLLLESIFLIVFNVVFFVAGGLPHNVSVWFAYGFIHLAYAMVLLTPILTGKHAQASVLGLSLYGISLTYFFAEFLVGLVFILLNSKSYSASLVTQIILACLYAAILLANVIVNEHTADSITKHEAEVFYIKNTASKLKALIDKAPDKKARKEIEKAYDTLHASSVKSSTAVEETERRIDCLVFELEQAVKCSDVDRAISVAQDIVAQTNARNRMLKNL